MIPVSDLTAVITSIEYLRSKGWKDKKAIESSFYKVFGKPSSSHWVSGTYNSDIVPYLKSISVSSTPAEIDMCYETINSCMNGKPVGEFYHSLGIVCIHIPDARALVNPTDNSFYVVYGKNHYILESILILMGLTCKKSWLDSIESSVASIVKAGTCSFIPYIDGNLNHYGLREGTEDIFISTGNEQEEHMLAAYYHYCDHSDSYPDGLIEALMENIFNFSTPEDVHSFVRTFS